MDTLKLSYNWEFDLYDYDSANNNLLDKIADLLTTEIQDSDLYKELLSKSPHEYRGNAVIITKVDSYIILRNQYDSSKYLIPNEKFKNLMAQWHNACSDKPDEMTISVDDNKNFTITYHKANNNPQANYINKIIPTEKIISYSDSASPLKDSFIELEYIDYELYVHETENNQLNLFAYLLISKVSASDYAERLNKPPFEYYDNRYYFAIVEDRILINDTIMEIKALPPLDKFLDLMYQWKLTTEKKPTLIRLSIDDDYNFKIHIPQPKHN